MKTPTKMVALRSLVANSGIGLVVSMTCCAVVVYLLNALTGGAINFSLGLHRVVPHLSEVRTSADQCALSGLANLAELVWGVTILVPLVLQIWLMAVESPSSDLQERIRSARPYAAMVYVLALSFGVFFYVAAYSGGAAFRVNIACNDLGEAVSGDQNRLIAISAMFWAFAGEAALLINRRNGINS